MKFRVRVSVIRVVEALDAPAARDIALSQAQGMDPKAQVLGEVELDVIDVNSIGSGISSTMR